MHRVAMTNYSTNKFTNRAWQKVYFAAAHDFRMSNPHWTSKQVHKAAMQAADNT